MLVLKGFGTYVGVLNRKGERAPCRQGTKGREASFQLEADPRAGTVRPLAHERCVRSTRRERGAHKTRVQRMAQMPIKGAHTEWAASGFLRLTLRPFCEC